MVKEFTKTLMIPKNKNETTALTRWLSCLEHDSQKGYITTL